MKSWYFVVKRPNLLGHPVVRLLTLARFARNVEKKVKMCPFFPFFKADIMSVPLLCMYDFQSLIEAETQSSKSVMCWCLEMGSRLRS